MYDNVRKPESDWYEAWLCRAPHRYHRHRLLRLLLEPVAGRRAEEKSPIRG